MIDVKRDEVARYEAEVPDPSTRDTRGHRSVFALAADWRLGPSTLIEAEFESSRQSQPSVVAFSLLGNKVPDALLKLSLLIRLTRAGTREALLQAIRTVAQGRRYVSARTAELLADELGGGGGGAPHEKLSDRELQVFLRLARGESVSDIAAVLNLSVKTISTYRTRLLEKLGVASNAELATYALRHGLILD